MSELDRIKAELAFYTEVLPLEEELEAAREGKKDDPERFQIAKQAYEEKRSFYRLIGEYLKDEADGNPDNVVRIGLDQIPTVADVVSPTGKKNKKGDD